MFTSGHSDEILLFTKDEDTHTLSYVDSWKVGSNFSYGHVSDKFRSIYFVHTVVDYEGTQNSGAVSRWKIDEGTLLTKNNPSSKASKDVNNRGTKITKQEVHLRICQ